MFRNMCSKSSKRVSAIKYLMDMCTAKRILTSSPTCKTFHYVDGAVAGGTPLDLGTAGVAVLIVGLTVWWVRARNGSNRATLASLRTLQGEA